MKVGDLVKYERTFRNVGGAMGLIIKIDDQRVMVLKGNGKLIVWTIRKGMVVISESR